MDITHKLKINASPEVIYHAVSSQEGIKGWWSADCSVGNTVGSDSLLKFNKEGMIVEMGFVTRDLQPNKKVVWECTSMPNPAWLGTKVITKISETEGGCDVNFSHEGFDEKWKGQEPFEQTKGGWNHFVKSLVFFCEGGEGQPW
ncbi:MAG: SRPBCC domain-containing protein [Saprospiraceae bacterium]